jgi:hypothetical protein
MSKERKRWRLFLNVSKEDALFTGSIIGFGLWYVLAGKADPAAFAVGVLALISFSVLLALRLKKK